MTRQRTFGGFTLDMHGAGLRDADGPVRLGHRALTLLAALIEAEGEIVSKPRLMDRAWPGLFVEEANLSVQISQLRKRLGTRPDGGDWIVTVPGLGYRFVPDRAATTSMAERPGLVVLPFDHAASDPDAGYFADGVVTDLITALTRFRSLSVVSRNIAFTYRGRLVDSRQVARELGIRYVLEGSLQRNGQSLRLTTQLVDGISGAQLWAKRHDGRLDDVFVVQDRIVTSVAALTAPSVQAIEVERSRRERPASLAAYDLYLRAMADLNDETEPANRRAFALLQQALETEPNNAAILCHASWALEHRHTMGWPPLGADDVELCLRLTRRALQHAGGDARIMAQCAMALMQTGRDYSSALAIMRAAVAANGNEPFVCAVAGVVCIHCGDLAEAESWLLHVLDIAPLDPDTRFALCGLAMIDVIRGDFQRALARAGHALAVNSHFDATYWMLVSANAHLGRMDEARHHLAGLLRLAPGVTVTSIRNGQPAMIPGRIEPILDGLRLAGLPE